MSEDAAASGFNLGELIKNDTTEVGNLRRTVAEEARKKNLFLHSWMRISRPWGGAYGLSPLKTKPPTRSDGNVVVHVFWNGAVPGRAKTKQSREYAALQELSRKLNSV